MDFLDKGFLRACHTICIGTIIIGGGSSQLITMEVHTAEKHALCRYPSRGDLIKTLEEFVQVNLVACLKECLE